VSPPRWRSGSARRVEGPTSGAHFPLDLAREGAKRMGGPVWRPPRALAEEREEPPALGRGHRDSGMGPRCGPGRSRTARLGVGPIVRDPELQRVACRRASNCGWPARWSPARATESLDRVLPEVPLGQRYAPDTDRGISARLVAVRRSGGDRLVSGKRSADPLEGIGLCPAVL
jgi:hypothetical protein